MLSSSGACHAIPSQGAGPKTPINFSSWVNFRSTPVLVPSSQQKTQSAQMTTWLCQLKQRGPKTDRKLHVPSIRIRIRTCDKAERISDPRDISSHIHLSQSAVMFPSAADISCKSCWLRGLAQPACKREPQRKDSQIHVFRAFHSFCMIVIWCQKLYSLPCWGDKLVGCGGKWLFCDEWQVSGGWH